MTQHGSNSESNVNWFSIGDREIIQTKWIFKVNTLTLSAMTYDFILPLSPHHVSLDGESFWLNAFENAKITRTNRILILG